MKRFLTFKFDSYYPTGGKSDFDTDFNTIQEAVASRTTGEYMDVLDHETGEWTEFTNIHGQWERYFPK